MDFVNKRSLSALPLFIRRPPLLLPSSLATTGPSIHPPPPHLSYSSSQSMMMMMMQNKHRIFAEDLLLAAEDHFDRVPDPIVLLIFNKLADARSLGRCSAVSRRFSALVPLVDDACLRIDRVISAAADHDGAPGAPRPRLSHLLKAALLAVLKPFAHCDARSAAAGQAKHAQMLQQQHQHQYHHHHSPAQVLKNFTSIRNLRMELPVSDVGTDDGVLLRWKAVFGSTLQSCVILGGTKVDPPRAAVAGPHAHAHAPAPAAANDPDAGDESTVGGSIPESFYTDGGLKLRVVWTISSLIAAATRHHLLRDIVREHPTLERVALTDAGGQGTLAMARDQIDEFRSKPLAAPAAASAAAANRTQVPACNMKLRYAPLLELSDGTRIHGATLVVIKPVGAEAGGGTKEVDDFVGDTFDRPFREAVTMLSKRRTYLLEMNGF